MVLRRVFSINCPKCGYDAGEFKFCPECGESLSVSLDKESVLEPLAEQENALKENPAPLKKIKKRWILLAIVVLAIAFFGNKSVVYSVKPVSDTDWSTIYSDYFDNAQTANKKYRNQKLKLYVYIDSIDDRSATVTFFDSNWNASPFRVTWPIVKFKDYSSLHQGKYYIISGRITQFSSISADGNSVGWITVEDAKVISERFG